MKTKSTLAVLLVAVLVLVLGVSTALAQDGGDTAEESQRLFLPMISSGEEETMLATGNGMVTVDNFTGGMLTLVDEESNPLANYPADHPAETRNLMYRYRCGGSWAPWTSVQTDGDGQFSYNPDCTAYAPAQWDNKITVTLNQTSLEQGVPVNSTFQAARVNVNLQTCSGPITDSPGGTVEQGGGYWYRHGTTGPSGTVSFYTFPGNIKVKMTYNHNNEERAGVVIAPGANGVDFVATNLTINHPGDVRSNKGGSWWMFSKPSMDLLAGDYPFQFQTGSTWSDTVTIAVSGCGMVYPPSTGDNTPPTAAPTQSPVASEGWNNTDVTVTWNWTDNSGGSGIDEDNCTTSSTSSDEGTIVLNATCKDLADNEGSASYTVKVDKTPPTLAPSVSPNPVALNGAATATSGAVDTLSEIDTEGCDPVDTSTPGPKSVTCTATDNAGNSNSAVASYLVSLQLSKQDVLASLAPLAGDKNVAKAIDHINKSLDPKYWVDANHLTSKGKKVFDEEKKAVKELMKLGQTQQAAINALVAIDASLAQTAIYEATAACPTLADPKDLAKCQEEVVKADKEMAKAQEELAKGDYDKAIDKYKKAWEHAQHAMKKVVEEVPEEE